MMVFVFVFVIPVAVFIFLLEFSGCLFSFHTPLSNLGGDIFLLCSHRRKSGWQVDEEQC